MKEETIREKTRNAMRFILSGGGGGNANYDSREREFENFVVSMIDQALTDKVATIRGEIVYLGYQTAVFVADDILKLPSLLLPASREEKYSSTGFSPETTITTF